MSRQKGRTSNSVSLFPFLAVLVCAMGALIFLLLVTTRRIRHQAVLDAIAAVQVAPETPVVLPVDVPVAPEVEQQPQPVPQPSAVAAPVPEVVEEPPPDPNAKLRDLIAALSQRRNEEQQRLDDLRRRLAAARITLSVADSRLSQLSQAQQTKQQERLTAGVNRQVALAEYTRLGEEADKAAVRLRRIEQQLETRSTKYSIVPFDGTSGTTRRPILLECTKDGLTFLEERITLTAADIDGFTVEYNPLLAGTRALVQHWNNRRKENPADDEGEPYVLLIVRPGGSIAYYAARKMLLELTQPTGYELVQEGLELDVPPADPQAVAACRGAIVSLLDQRRKLVDSVAAAGNGGDGALRFRSGSGGLEPVEQEESIFDRAGKPGFGERPGRFGGTTRRATGNGLPGDGAPGGTGDGQPGDDGSGGNALGGDAERKSSFADYRQNRGGTGQPRTGDENRPGGPAASKEGTAELGGREFGSGPLAGGRPETSRGAAGQAAGAGDPRNSQAGPFAAGSRPATFGSIGESGAAAGSLAEGSSDPNGGGAAGESPGFGSPGRGDAGGGQAGGSAGGGDTGSGGDAAGGSDRKPPIPLRTFGRTAGMPEQPPGSRPASRAWGIGAVRNGIGFERETVITIKPNRIRVGSRPEVAIDRFGAVDQMIEYVLDDLDRHARTWGRPPENFHWVPVVRFLVSPGGNQYYERLHGPLRKVGIGSTVEYPLE